MKFFFSFVFFIFLSVNTFAQYSWQLKISGGGRGNPITIDPINKNIIYYGSSSTIYKSTDRGDTFVPFGSTIPGSSAIKSFHLNPNRPNEMVVAVYKGNGYKMVKTTDNGASWTTTHDNLSFSFYGVPSTQDPTHPDSIYIMNGNNFDRSTDFGETWTTLTSSVGTFTAPCDIEVFPDTSIILVGDNGTGIFRSTDYGQTWASVYSTSGEIPTIAVDFNKPGTAWATKFSGGGGVIRSTNYGQSWTTIAYSGISTWGVHIHPDNSDYVVVGTWSGSNVYITRNWGTNWLQTSLPASNYAVAVIDTMNVFAAQSGGFYKLDSPYFVPVELISFTAKVVDNKALLEWSTASEINNQGFDVEMSYDNQSFEKIAFIPGFGTSSEQHSYSHTVDKLLSEKNYFRLRQVDFDGTFEYSPVVEVDGLLPSEFYLAQNHPNPFNPATSIQFSLPVEASVKIQLFNMLGEKVTEITNREFSAGVHIINFTSDGLSSGTYLYLLEAKGSNGVIFNQTKKMLLLK
jgi:photosystem II stability/assembly factor-like uncharacterized protein